MTTPAPRPPALSISPASSGAEGPYRGVVLLPDEEGACTDLRDRATRLRRRIALVGIPACAALASPVLLLWYALLQHHGRYTSRPLLHQGLAAWSVYTVVFVLCIALMLRLTRVLVRRRALRWIDDIAASRHVDREHLVEVWRLVT